MIRTSSSGFALLIALSLVGCRQAAPSRAPIVRAATVSAALPSTPPRPAIDLMKVRPNELGWIPVLMYHEIGGEAYRGARYDRNGLNIPVETFRHQLQLMHAAGWYPLNMRDVAADRIDVPPGKIPVVLTFDDGRETQFHYLSDGTMDPNCAVSIMEQFHSEHPDWPLRGSFYLLPESKWNPCPFYQKKSVAKKLKHLLDDGFELANHSTSHRRMDRMDAHLLAWEMAECLRYVKKLAPAATMDTMALPMGYVPRTRALLDVLLHGRDGGTDYQNLCILRAWGGPTLPPTNKDYDPRDIKRIGSSPGYVERWIRNMKRGSEYEPFVSDGDPNVISIPKRLEKRLARSRLTRLQIVEYEDRPAKPPAKTAAPKKLAHKLTAAK